MYGGKRRCTSVYFQLSVNIAMLGYGICQGQRPRIFFNYDKACWTKKYTDYILTCVCITFNAGSDFCFLSDTIRWDRLFCHSKFLYHFLNNILWGQARNTIFLPIFTLIWLKWFDDVPSSSYEDMLFISFATIWIRSWADCVKGKANSMRLSGSNIITQGILVSLKFHYSGVHCIMFCKMALSLRELLQNI